MRSFRIAAGVFFIILGILGLFLPILQGLLFLALGFFFLSRDLPCARKILTTAQRKFPRFRKLIGRAKNIFQKKEAVPSLAASAKRT